MTERRQTYTVIASIAQAQCEVQASSPDDAIDRAALSANLCHQCSGNGDPECWCAHATALVLAPEVAARKPDPTPPQERANHRPYWVKLLGSTR